MRLNWFLPPKKASADRLWPVAVRRFLTKLGPTWEASPLRRLIQTGFFLLFLFLFFYVLRPSRATATAGSHPGPVELFLMLDPLVSLSTVIAGRAWVWSLTGAAIILAIGLVLPRSFCGYICPLGTLIDLCDWGVNNRLRRVAPIRRGWWVHLKYYLVVSILVAALFGVLISGFFAAIPVLTRGMAFMVAPLQRALTTGSPVAPPIHAGHYISIAMFLLVLGLGLLGPRFWCRYVCPTGAIFSVLCYLRLTSRHVEKTCTHCGLCQAVCPFDAIRDDATTRTADCTFCQTCGGVCRARAIRFSFRWNRSNVVPAAKPAEKPALSRRGFLIAAAASGAVVAGTRSGVFGVRATTAGAALPVRPPGSVPEEQFLRTCIRCQECTRACPTGVLQPLGFEQGFDALWTANANTDWAGCDSQCNLCGHICPTGAIHSLPLDQKKQVRMGLAVVNDKTCLPYAGRQTCQLCYDACSHAGYDAIEFIRVRVQIDEAGEPVSDTGFLAPIVSPNRCVGCGQCQSRCYHINVREKPLLQQAAIIVQAGPGKEDRLPAASSWFKRKDVRQASPVQTAAPAPATSSATQPAVDIDLPDFMQE